MKFTLILLIVSCLLGLLEAQKGASKLDSVDVDSVLGNNRILSNYIKCLLDKGPCTQEGRELKRLLPDAVATDCSKCSESQKRNSKKIINYLRSNKPAEWKKLLDKYDPKGLFVARHGGRG